MERLLFYRLENSAMTSDIPMSGSAVKTTFDQRGKTFVCTTDNFVPLVVPGLSTSSGSNPSSTSTSQDLSSTTPAQERSDGPARREWCADPQERSDEPAPREWCADHPRKPRTKKKGMVVEIRTTVCEIFLNGWRRSQIIWRTQNSQDSDSERPTKVVSRSRKHTIKTHFPKDRNCEVCLRTKMTIAPGRKRTGEAVPRQEKFGDLITADHTVLNEESESRNHHRYAGVVQDLATQWIQSYPCKTKTSQETKRVYESSSSRRKNQKLFKRTIHWNLENVERIFHGIIKPQHLIDPSVLFKSGLDEKWWADSLEYYCYLRNVQHLLAEGKIRMKDDMEIHSKGQ